MLNGILGVAEGQEWNAGAIVTLICTQAFTLYKLLKTEKRTDNDQETARDESLVGQWRAWGKAMEKGRNDAIKRQSDSEDRERKLIGEVSRLAECVRQKDSRIEELERESDHK